MLYDDTLYIATDAGVKRTATVGTAPAMAGLPRCIAIKAVLAVPSTGASSGFSATGNQFAYRAIYSRTDANERLLESVPSGRSVVINAAGDRDATVTVPLASGIAAGDKVKLYRSLQSGAASTQPSDDLYLAKEVILASGDITAGLVTITDDVKQDALGERLYTSDVGIEQSNFRPPLCKDMAVFRDTAFFANTRQPHRLIVRLQRVYKSSVSPGLADNDTLVIAGVTYTADNVEANEDAATGKFWLDDSSTDARTRIMNTAMSLCRVVNGNASNTTVYAYYEGEYGSDPGLIVIERRDFTDTSFAMTAGSAGAGSGFSPVLPTTGTTVSSKADERKNYLSFSRTYQPDAVPLVNELPIGDEAEEIVRIISVRAALWVFCKSGKVYRVTGYDGNSWQVSLFSDSVKIYGPKTAVGVESGVVLFTTSGLLSCSDSGIKNIGDPIEDKLMPYMSLTAYPNFKRDAHAVAYNSDKCYILTHSQICYCYCWDTGAWTTWDCETDASFVSLSKDRIFASIDTGYITREKKAGTKFDYADGLTAVTVVSYTGLDVTLSSASGLTVGQGLYQTDTRYGIITAINSNVVTLDRGGSWQPGTAYAMDYFTVEVVWNNWTGGNPGQLKRLKECAIFWRFSDGDYKMLLATNFDPTYLEHDITPVYSTAVWGGFAWGAQQWGGSQGGEMANRGQFDYSKVRALWARVGVKVEIPWNQFALIGYCITAEATGSKFLEG
jgi:hypothetical protein